MQQPIALRFIPVHTGNTRIGLFRQSTRSVYPCAYREHKYMGARSDTNRGLSLCIQGTQRAECDFLYGARFIPVYTGNPQSIQGVFSLSTVYPCVYREPRIKFHHDHVTNGLSLCIQGTPQL